MIDIPELAKIITLNMNNGEPLTTVAFENPLFTGVNPRKPPYSGFGPTFSKGWVEENGGLRGQGPRGEQNFVPFFQKGDEEGQDEEGQEESEGKLESFQSFISKKK